MTMSKIPGSSGWPLLALVLLAACGPSEEREWQDARMKRSAEAYEQFLENYPEGEFAADAREALETLRFKQAQKENTLDAFTGFLELHPDGQHAEEATRTVEMMHWVQAQRQNTQGSYERYLEKYPEGRFADDAGERIAPFLLAGLARSREPADFEAFLERNPEGAAADHARSLLERLLYQEARAAGTPEAYQAFLERFPEGRYAEEARRRGAPGIRAAAGESRLWTHYDGGAPAGSGEGWSFAAEGPPAVVSYGEGEAPAARTGAWREVIVRLENKASESRSLTFEETLATGSSALVADGRRTLERPVELQAFRIPGTPAEAASLLAPELAGALELRLGAGGKTWLLLLFDVPPNRNSLTVEVAGLDPVEFALQ